MSEVFSQFKSTKPSREDCLRLFDGSRAAGILAAQVMRENPDLYRAVKESAISHGLLAPPRANPNLQSGERTGPRETSTAAGLFAVKRLPIDFLPLLQGQIQALTLALR